MGKTMRIWLIAAVALLLIGGVLFGGAMMLLQWDFTKLNTQKMQTNTHDPMGDVQSISVESIEADISFLPSETEGCRVVCYENVKAKHTAEVVDGVLKIKINDTRKWSAETCISKQRLRIFVSRTRLNEGGIGRLILLLRHSLVTQQALHSLLLRTHSLKLRKVTGHLQLNITRVQTREQLPFFHIITFGYIDTQDLSRYLKRQIYGIIGCCHTCKIAVDIIDCRNPRGSHIARLNITLVSTLTAGCEQ